jgi:hypothetical protein
MNAKKINIEGQLGIIQLGIIAQLNPESAPPVNSLTVGVRMPNGLSSLT